MNSSDCSIGNCVSGVCAGSYKRLKYQIILEIELLFLKLIMFLANVSIQPIVRAVIA